MLTKTIFPLYELCFKQRIFDDISKDILKYRSALRRKTIKKSSLHGLVENHHIIPQQWRNHEVIKRLNYDLNRSYNLCILPNKLYSKNCNKNDNFTLIHEKGHMQYNAYVKEQLDVINEYINDDEFKYKFWLFYIFLKSSLDNNNIDNIPWN